MKRFGSVSSKNSGRLRSWSLPLIAAGIMLILAWFFVSVFRVNSVFQSLSDSRQEIVTLLENRSVTNIDPEDAERLVQSIRQDVLILKSVVGPIVTIGPELGWVPKIGPLLAASPDLLIMADAGSEGALLAFHAVKPALTMLQEGNATYTTEFPDLVRSLAGARPLLAEAAASTETMIQARNRLQHVDQLPWRIQNALNQVDPLLPSLQSGLIVSQVLPELMGIDGQRSYLIVAQNEDELRPTGGFISGAGVFVVESGNLQSLDFESAENVDDYENKPYDLPPKPFTEFLGMDIFLFRDANFWPDFPSSAEKAMELYTYGQGGKLDGAIAIDQKFLQLLLAAIGPVDVPEFEKEVNGDNVISEMRAQWHPESEDEGNPTSWILNRKSFMGPLANALFNKISLELHSLDLFSLAQALQTAIETGHLQIYMRDPEVARSLAKTGWDGRLDPETGSDFLMIVDTNLGFNKTDAVIDRHLSYQVTLDPGGQTQANVEITYLNRAQPSEQPCQPIKLYTLDLTYDDLINDCYWNYVRVYSPAGSQLISASEHPLPGNLLLSGQEWPGQARPVADASESTTTFDNFLFIEPGQQEIAQFTYTLSSVIEQSLHDTKHYNLLIAKQAGTKEMPISVTITLPPETRLLETWPEATNIRDQEITFSANLATDLTFSVRYE